ncbi:MAG: hypothetical protein HUJ76_02095 [Parasporobacterium sp.]|nr:hypothetical protein [Parasporobacterium sp.]
MAEKVLGKVAEPNQEEHAQITLKVADLVTAVNGIMNPGGPVFDWFAGYENGAAAVEIRNGNTEIVNEKILMGCEIDGQHISNIKVVGYEGKDGGVYCEGPETNAVIENAYISLEGTGKGVGGPDTGVSARKGAIVTIKNAVINGYGRSRFCTTAETGSSMYVYDSVLWSHGQPWGDGYEPITEPMATPPAALLIEGNSRAHCTMTNSSSYFYDSKIICDGWGALSTEGAEGYVYLEANDCDIIATRRGYGTYADPDCHVVFNRCSFDVADMSIILAGKSDAHFNECVCDNGSYFALVHNVNGTPEEVGELEITSSQIHSSGPVIFCRSENVEINVSRSELSSDEGIIIRSEENDDPARTIPSDHPYGIRASFKEMKLEGDIIHEDPARDMYITLEKAYLIGTVKGANLKMDTRSTWYSPEDSEITLTGDVFLNQIDAPEGKIIKAKGASEGEYTLFSGGKLVISK